MMIPYHVQIGETLSVQKRQGVQHLIETLFTMIDETFNHFNPRSELSQINRLEPDIAMNISMEMETGLQLAKECYVLTKGLYNPLMGRAINAWKLALKQGTKPVSFERVTFDDLTITHTLKKSKPLEIDLDGMIKGYLIDRLTESLTDAGFKSFYINWGGEIRTVGNHPSGRPWRIMIEHTGESIDLKDQAIATSSYCLQNASIEGEWYSHILNSKKGQPIPITDQMPMAISVIAPSCAVADAVATAALSLYDKEALMAWKRELVYSRPHE